MFRLRGFGKYGLLLDAGVMLTVWSAGVGALWFLLPQIVSGFTGSVALIGCVMSIPPLVALLVDVPVGGLVDRVGRRSVLLASLFMLLLLAFLLVLVDGLVSLVFFLLLLGLFHQPVWISSVAYVMDLSPSGKSSEILGLEMGFLNLGFAVGPVLAGLAVAYLDSRVFAASLIFSIACFTAFLLAMSLREDMAGRESVRQGFKDLVFKDKLFVKELSDYRRMGSTGVAILLFTFMFTFFDGVVWTFEPLYYSRFSDQVLLGGLLMSSFIVPLILFEAPAGLLADRFGRRRILSLGLLAAGVFSVLFSQSSSIEHLILTGFLSASGIAFAWPSIEGLLAVKAGKGSRGEAVGVSTMAEDLGYVLGPVVGGLVSVYFGMSSVFLFMGLVLIASVFTVFLVED
ncbi:MAG: MFS transporter [Candidatus Altiarchaeota archaeon]